MSLLRLGPHVTLGLYVSLLGLLLASLALASGGAYLHYVLLFLATLLGAYAVFWKLSARLPLRVSAPAGGVASWRDSAATLVLAAALIFAGAHLARLGGIPVIQGMLEKDYYVVMLIRQYIFHAELHPVWKYGPNILVKSIFPFLVFYFLCRSRLLLVVALLAGGLYAVSLMNKLFIILLVTPAAIHAFTSRRWLAVTGLSVIPVLGLAFLVMVQNPHMQPQSFVDALDEMRNHTSLTLDAAERAALVRYYEVHRPEGENAAEGENAVEGENAAEIHQDHSTSSLSIASDTIFRRVFLVPGAVMTSWFSNIPSRLPYARGCGYRWLAPMVGCEYVAYAVLINDIENPGLATRGVRGSMTAASFIADYANFGAMGLALSGLVLATILVAIARLFGSDWRDNLALNAVPLILLLELPLSTVILTGGWIITLFLYLFIARQPASAPDYANSV